MSFTYLQKECTNNCYHGVNFFEKLKHQILNVQNRRSGEIYNNIFETYKDHYIPHGKHMFKTASEMSMAKMCAYQ